MYTLKMTSHPTTIAPETMLMATCLLDCIPQLTLTTLLAVAPADAPPMLSSQKLLT